MAKKNGRPSIYSDALVTQICSLLADGKSLRTICKAKGMPHSETVRKWLIDKPGFSVQYARAREEQADSMADDIVAIADNPKLDPNDKRVRVDARKWVAAKLKPKKYGDRLELGGDLGVTYRSGDEILGALNSLLSRNGVEPVVAPSAKGGADNPSGRRSPRKSK